MNFPGTVTLSQETYRNVIIEIGASLAEHGVERFVAVNCHGGNREPLSLAADRLSRDHGLKVHFIHWTDFARERLEDAFGEDWGHAGDHETSVIEHYRPDLVKGDRKEPQTTRDWPETRSYAYFDDITEQGGLGDPTNSDPEAVAEIIDEATHDILEQFVTDLENGW